LDLDSDCENEGGSGNESEIGSTAAGQYVHIPNRANVRVHSAQQLEVEEGEVGLVVVVVVVAVEA
jgi:hypothetical protein